MRDYVIANGNEKDFIEMAERLGFTELVFVGDVDVAKLKSKIKLSSSKRIFRSNSEKDRMLIESKRADIIYDFEEMNRKDTMHFRNSGMNHVIANLMKEKNVAYGLSFSSILNASRQKQALFIGRAMQNLVLCRKYKVKTVIASFARHPFEMRDPKDLVAFAKSLGLNDYRA